MTRKKWIAATLAIAFVAALAYRTALRGDRSEGSVAPQSIVPEDAASTNDRTRESSLKEVLELAESSLQHMSATLEDCTARFVKQETVSGVLQESSEVLLKVQSPLRNETDDAPLRVYLGFRKPESVRGREVIWAADKYDGQLVVHEAGLLGLMTLRLDPNGLIAMRGERYPITEIGLAKLVEKLIERGQPDLGDPDIRVTITGDHRFDDVTTDLIQVRRSKPDGSKTDFSLAEIVIDRDRQLVLSYRSFGWPETPGDEPPLQEFYAYHDLKVNVGLTEMDFDPTNPEYQYP